MAPLPPLPENNTARLFLDYTSVGRAHVALVRLLAGAVASDAAVVAADVAAVMATRMLDIDNVVAARFSAAGSNISVPITFTPVAGVITGALTTWENDPESAYITLPGRDAVEGRKMRFGMFTPVKTVTWPPNNRYEPGEAAPIDTWRLNMVSALSDGITPRQVAVTIGNNLPTFASYVNISHNAYWQRKQRRGG